MPQPFIEDDLFEQKFRVEFSDPSQGKVRSPYTLTGSDLFAADQRDQILDRFKDLIEAPSRDVAASLFAKWYTLPMAALYAMSRYQYGIDVSPERLRVRVDKWPYFLVEETGASVCPQEGREQWRADLLRQLFSRHVDPLYRSLAEYSGLSIHAFWAHTAYVIGYWYPLWISQTESQPVQQSLRMDYRFLTQEAPAELFGPYDKNPLSTRFRTIEHPAEPDNQVRIRKQCCFIYKLPSVGRCCYTCPRLTEEERVERLQTL
ncbi:(2Fe-2S)-binding protein [Brevibacillus humidisoli]|uniref:IucA/IucC family C-terminal-domain containing protein n=1 Tax=Brevibacillus humidisoli TaxID=2895522 RepID=UPI001E5FF68D|nr:IucA/IucC family C-terminal-domain containing protein [Brevibacillus humidisoli]UFJ40883.1 (2Fe-2S)-binding protein [Brevibacillus humidisoli]